MGIVMFCMIFMFFLSLAVCVGWTLGVPIAHFWVQNSGKVGVRGAVIYSTGIGVSTTVLISILYAITRLAAMM